MPYRKLRNIAQLIRATLSEVWGWDLTYLAVQFSRYTSARDGAIRPNGSAKGALGVVFNVAKSVLGNTEGLGEKSSQFSADVLAKLITPEMRVRVELKSVLDLP